MGNTEFIMLVIPKHEFVVVRLFDSIDSSYGFDPLSDIEHLERQSWSACQRTKFNRNLEVVIYEYSSSNNKRS